MLILKRELFKSSKQKNRYHKIISFKQNNNQPFEKKEFSKFLY